MAFPKRPIDFRMMMVHDPQGIEKPISVSFSAEWEYEIDAVIRALRVAQEILRMETSPIPRSRSLVVHL